MYIPGELPTTSIEELKRALDDELLKISEALRVGEFESINLQKLSVTPDKPRNGDIINADGTNFNPGEGAGIYGYLTDYTKLG